MYDVQLLQIWWAPSLRPSQEDAQLGPVVEHLGAT
jgi:hypothetical protein